MFNIGRKIIAYLVLLAVMATVPIITIKYSDNAEKPNNSSADTPAESNDKNYIITGLTAALCSDNFSEESIRAAAILIINNYSVNPNDFDLTDKNIFLDEKYVDDSNKDYYSKVKKVVNSLDELSITADNKSIFIPYSTVSSGYTLNSDESDYIISVASPWDCFSSEYSNDTKCIGVSIYGINYLCSNGASAEEALKWYLPKLEIE